MKYLFGFLLLFSAQSVFAQKELLITTSDGWKVNYNKLHSDKPLPTGMLQHSRYSGFSFSMGLEYKPNPHWGIHAQLKTAEVEFGLQTKASVQFDTINGQYKTCRGYGGGSSTGSAPAHYELGATYYSNPVKNSKFSWLAGGGGAYLVTTYKISAGSANNDSWIGVSNSGYNERYKIYGKSFDANLSEEFSRNGILLNIHTGLDFHFAPKHHLLLTLQHNEGLRRIRQYRSNYFNYVDLTPDKKTSEAFAVVIFSKGSYTALQLGYKYALFASK